ncbi:hypothetical protein [Aureimonas sp. Leaf324]|nr:hypothetical protein [Aureimonas sp. Leaf324]
MHALACEFGEIDEFLVDIVRLGGELADQVATISDSPAPFV